MTPLSLPLEGKVAAKPPDEVFAAKGGASVLIKSNLSMPADTSSVIVG